MIPVALLEEPHAFAHERVENQRMRPAPASCALLERGNKRGHTVAIQTLRVPAERYPLLVHRFHAHHVPRRPVRLLIVAIDEGVQAVEAVVPARHGGFPGNPFLKFAVRQKIEDACFPPLQAQPQSHAHRLRQAVAERAAGHLEAGRQLAS